jgi:hypothetical protein
MRLSENALQHFFVRYDTYGLYVAMIPSAATGRHCAKLICVSTGSIIVLGRTSKTIFLGGNSKIVQ